MLASSFVVTFFIIQTTMAKIAFVAFGASGVQASKARLHVVALVDLGRVEGGPPEPTIHNYLVLA